MKKNLLTSDRSTLGSDGYSSPKMEISEMNAEGILCSSFQEYDEIEVEW